MITWSDYARLEREDSERVSFKLVYVDMAGDLEAGLLLSQIVYWHLPSKQGKSKLAIQHEGKKWIAKKREDWWAEVRLKPRQVDRCMRILEDRGLVKTRLFKFRGAPTTHVRLDVEKFLEVWAELNSPNGENDLDESVRSISPDREMVLPASVNSSTTDTTSDTTSENTKHSASSSDATSSLHEHLCHDGSYSEAFEECWGFWLRKSRNKNKLGAGDEWNRTLQRLSKDRSPDEAARLLLRCTQNYFADCDGKDPRYIMYAARFFGGNQEWQDFETWKPTKRQTDGVSRDASYYDCWGKEPESQTCVGPSSAIQR